MPYGRGRRSLRQSIDWPLVICYLLLVIIGWLNIYAASHASEAAGILDFATRSGKQFVWILSGIFLAIVILFVFNPRLWEVIAFPSYLIVFLLLVAVIFVGAEIKGSHSWFSLGPVSFQPAEVSKITTALLLSAIMSRQGFNLGNKKDLILAAAIVLVPMLTIVAEKETGSALVYVGFLFVFYREGLSGWFLVAAALAIAIFIITLTVSPFASLLMLLVVVSLCFSANTGNIKRWILRDLPLLVLLAFLPRIWAAAGGEEPSGLWARFQPSHVLLMLIAITTLWYSIRGYKAKSLPHWVAVFTVLAGMAMTYSTEFIFNDILQDHQRKRIEVLLGLMEDPSGVGYNVHQSMIAIGSGGFAGKGFLQGTQTTYGFVPEQSTDFIFCTVGEEWGFIGCLFVILIYAFMIARIILDAEECRDHFTRIYGYCVASIIFMHLFINVGMTIGLMPVIGIPLPLLSYGGSSLWAFTILIFIFLALYKDESKYF